jgi:hypothetical protein
MLTPNRHIHATPDVRNGEEFRTPAPYETVVRLLGPAFESLPGRKPRGGWGLVGRATAYGDSGVAD